MWSITIPSPPLLKSPPSLKPGALRPNTASIDSSGKGISSAFGLKPRPCFRARAMATVYKVKLITPEGEQEIEAPDDQYLLDSAEGRLMLNLRRELASGSVDQSEGSFLDDKQMEEGYVLTCVSYPKSDCVVYTHKEEDLQ